MELRHIAQREGKLSTFLHRELQMSSGLINRLKYQGALLVGGEPVRTNYPVRPGDEITVLLDEAPPSYPPEPMSLSVLYEDADLIALDKPQGVLIHPSRNRNEGTLANGLAYYYQATGQKSAFHPVSRLDRDTYGVVLLAKNAHIHALLNEQHRLGEIKKTYHALVFGGPTEAEGRLEAPIARRELPSLLREVREDGKESVTEFRVLERYARGSFLELRPLTGRTHQLRVHCAYFGFPILGDPQYGSEESKAFSESLHLEAQALCAKKLCFRHPTTGKTLEIYSKMTVPSNLLDQPYDIVK